MVSAAHATHAGPSLRDTARRAPMLDPETERRLVEETRGGSETAILALIQSHLRLVLSIAQGYARHGTSEDDLVAEGIVGLLEASKRFDPTRGIRFATYAAWWVRAFVRRYALANRRIVSPPATRSARKIMSGLRRVQRELVERGQAPRRDAVAAAMGVSADDVALVEGLLEGRDVPLGGGHGDGIDPANDEPTPEQATAEAQIRAKQVACVERALGGLSERERAIVELRMLNDDRASLADLGERLGLSRERVRQIEKRAESKLRAALLECVA